MEVGYPFHGDVLSDSLCCVHTHMYSLGDTVEPFFGRPSFPWVVCLLGVSCVPHFCVSGARVFAVALDTRVTKRLGSFFRYFFEYFGTSSC